MKIILHFVIVFIIIISGTGFASINISINKNNNLNENTTEYWALLVGCNEFINMPSATLPGNDITAKDFYKTLLSSDHWHEDHIKLLTGKNASSINILKGLRWLDQMDDEDDICLFYIATHGGPGPDYFPKDEEDGMDEWLTTYSTYSWYIPKLGGAIQLPYIHRLSDDQINHLLSLLDAKGVCAIIDACYSGGFNESTYNNKKIEYTSDDLLKGFSEEFIGSGRVLIMSTKEDEITLTWYFAHCLMEGFQGFGNINDDTMVSAEEAFKYSAPKTTNYLYTKYGELYEPQILDEYEGDLLLTDINLPPERADLTGQKISKPDKNCYFNISSNDSEGDRIHFYVNWGNGNEEWTDYKKSGDSVSLTHLWEDIGTYNIWFNNEDEYGATYSFGPILDSIAVSIVDEGENVDQKQTLFFDGADVDDGVFAKTVWLSQSFVPSYSTLSRVDLLLSTSPYYAGPITISIRNNLSENDIVEFTAFPQVIDNWFIERLKWTTFDFPDFEVIPGETYYLVIHCEKTDSLCAWMHVNKDCNLHPDYQNDPYEKGKAFLSKNLGRSWFESSKINDFCFVTYGGI